MSIASSIAGGGSSSGSGGGGGIGGSTGSTDNMVLRANGSGGSTAQGSGATLDDSVTLTVNAVLCYAAGNQSGDEKVQMAGGSGGTLLSSDSDVRWYNDPDISSGAPHVSLISPATNVLRIGNGTTGGGVLELIERSAPAGAADAARIFARDNGSGKTQICVQFATGAVQVLATEP